MYVYISVFLLLTVYQYSTKYISLLNIYFPCDNYSNNDVSNRYVDCMDYIESVINVSNCNSFICCGDWNTNIERYNTPTKYVCDFISRNHFVNSCDHVLSL